VGPDGNFYQPAANRLTPYSLVGQWPDSGLGNRPGKAPIRYYGRYFYSTGETTVNVPAGEVHVLVWKGLEYTPAVTSVVVTPRATREITIVLERPVPSDSLGYYPGDVHLHFPRRSEADDQILFDLLDAEGLRYGAILAYNEPPGSYTGTMSSQVAPQLRGLGRRSTRSRNGTWITSGQEYRTSTYGHLNLYGRDSLVLEGEQTKADNWPPLGQLGRSAAESGGFAIMAHGGYSQSIYSDFVQKNVRAVELLQFGTYRGIGLDDWYRILNIGYQLPCVGASDYPACRSLGDCRTYVQLPPQSDFHDWFVAASKGQSFVTTGPLLFLEVDNMPPGSTIKRLGPGPRSFQVRVRVRSEVASVQSVTLIVGGKVVLEHVIPPTRSTGHWIELNGKIELTKSAWIAARATGKAPSGAPDAEAHTNPVYVHIDHKAPYDRDALDHLVARLDEQMAIHQKRAFPEKARVLDDFQRSRDILLKIREAGGLSSEGGPESFIIDRTAEALDPSRRSHSDRELEQFLQPIAAKTPEEALKTFETAGGFHLELVAGDSQVQSPVAAAFDADGNLYVAEMRDYPYKPKPGRTPLGSVRLLRDTDGDGQFDQSTIFADGLLWAAGIAPWKGGVFVTAPPDIWYLRDDDHDGKADVREKWYTGFGTQNQQAMVNNLTWGLDHKIYGAASGNGGFIRPGTDPQASGVSVARTDFCFSPVSGLFETVSGSEQFGNTFDDWGNRFICNESHPISHPVLPQRALLQNPFLTVSSTVNDILGGAVPIFRISPIERWRQIRSSRRIAHGARSATAAGASHHVVDAGAGVTVYRGSAYPAEFYGNIFVGDAQNNLIHRRILVPSGPTFRALRAPSEQKTEFVRSSDNWFRPVNFVNAPDGTLYVLDMSRAVIEAIHIPLDVVKHLDLKQGRSQGRIYRIAPDGFRFRPPPRLSQATTIELVAALKRPDAWYRDTAHRLIFERQDRAAIEPLRKLLTPADAPLPQTRVNALWSLEGLNALGDIEIENALRDPVSQVRAQAVELAALHRFGSPALQKGVVSLAVDQDPSVRFQVAMALGLIDQPDAVDALVEIARRDLGDRWIRTAVLSSSAKVADHLLNKLWDPKLVQGNESLMSFLEKLAEIVGAANNPAAVDRVLEHLAGDETNRTQRDLLVLSVARGRRRSGNPKPLEGNSRSPGTGLVASLTQKAMSDAFDQKLQEDTRVSAIERLSILRPAGLCKTLSPLLDATQPAGVQKSVLSAFINDEAADVPAVIVPRLARFEPSVRATAVDTLLARAPWTKTLLTLMARENRAAGITPDLIGPVKRSALLKSSDPEIARLAQQLFAQSTPTARLDVVRDYVAALGSNSNAANGVKIFERECMQCHKVGGRGFDVGPDLTGSPSSDSTALVANILDPNANVAPALVQYVVIDHDGRTFSGVIAGETVTSVTLRGPSGAQETVLRSQIAELKSTGLSLMPEGLEKRITKAEMADLVAYLRASHRGDSDVPPDRNRPLDIGTLPGLIEPDE
jgi:putative membrane-bound dehydrogenase-like protein